MEPIHKDIKPMEHFYPLLCMEKEVIGALERHFEDRSNEIIGKLQTGSKLGEDEGDVYCIIADLIPDFAVAEEEMLGLGRDDLFPIRIMHYGPLYYIEAIEFDNIAYFENIETASCLASDEFCSFLGGLSEFEDEDGSEANEEEVE